MSQETINLIIGILAGIIPSVVLTWLNNKSQKDRDIRSRDWLINDLIANRKIAIGERRIDKAEKFVDEFAQAVFSMLDDITLLEEDTLAADIQHLFNKNRLFHANLYNAGSVSCLDSESLSNEFRNLQEHYGQVSYFINSQMEEVVEHGDYSTWVKERKKVIALKREVIASYAKLLRTFDSLRDDLSPYEEVQYS